jgi:anti-anti-sigma factor
MEAAMPEVRATEPFRLAVRRHSAISARPGKADTPQFAIQWLEPSTAVVTGIGEIDASNTDRLIDYVHGKALLCRSLVLDLTALTFLGVEGFSMLCTLSERCAKADIGWVLVPGAAVNRVLRICDAERRLATAATVAAALCVIDADPGRRLQLTLGDGRN